MNIDIILLLCAGMAFACCGFVIGKRWGEETITHRLAHDTDEETHQMRMRVGLTNDPSAMYWYWRRDQERDPEIRRLSLVDYAIQATSPDVFLGKSDS